MKRLPRFNRGLLYNIILGGHVPRLAKNICNVIVQGSIPWLSTIMVCSSNGRTQDFHSCNMGSNPVQITRFVGVTANITDCRSVAMGSTPVRTAKNVEWCNGLAFQSLKLMVLVQIQTQ